MYLRGNHDSYEFNNQDYPNLKTFSELWTEYKYDNVSINGIEISNENCTSFYSTLSLNEDNINALLNKVNVIIRSNVIDNSDVPLDKIWFVTKVNKYKED